MDEHQFQGALKNLFAKTGDLLTWIGNSFLSDENKTLYSTLFSWKISVRSQFAGGPQSFNYISKLDVGDK